MTWQEEVDIELDRGKIADRMGNHGRARVCARRAVGKALTELYKRRDNRDVGNDAMKLIELFLGEDLPPDNVRTAGERLRARVRHDLTSLSESPLDDAAIIISYVRSSLS